MTIDYASHDLKLIQISTGSTISPYVPLQKTWQSQTINCHCKQSPRPRCHQHPLCQHMITMNCSRRPPFRSGNSMSVLADRGTAWSSAKIQVRPPCGAEAACLFWPTVGHLTALDSKTTVGRDRYDVNWWQWRGRGKQRTMMI